MLFNTSEKTKNEYVNEILSNDSFTNLKLDLIDLDLKIKAGDHFEVHYRGPVDKKMEQDKTAPNDPYLFNFHNRFSTSDSLNANANTGIKQMCKSMGMKKENYYCVYTFRHTWGTVAQNDCGATIAEVGFAMNHSHGHTVTRGYLKIDFTPAWELNAKVIDFILFSKKRSKQGDRKSVV